MNKLVEIPPSEWPALRDSFLPNWPSEHVGYYLVDNYVKWVEKDPNIKNLKFYSLNGDWSDGTFVVVDRYQLFVYTLSSNNDRLTDLLRLLDWSKGFKVSSFREKFRPAVLTVVDELNLEREYDSDTFLYFLPRDEAKNLEISLPDGFSLKPMSSMEHARKANDVWPNRHEGSLFFLKRLIDWNPQIGLFNGNELVAWCFRLQSGPLGALQVDEKYFRRGFGSIVTKKMAQILAEMDQDTFALVGIQNIASQKMFEKIGFKVTDHCFWLRTIPTVPFTWKD
ncbi:uncharacterized protein LOC134831981 [Culicoides brevitarsis]|uniref:uncharacterized protein LOC134831981 n=1 Tax=Culicoides brevitarsis TaxID=469753 RepID=UPI00307C306C